VFLAEIGAVQLRYEWGRYSLCADPKMVSEVSDSKYTTWLEDFGSDNVLILQVREWLDSGDIRVGKG